MSIPPPTTPDASKLLESFLSSGHSQQAFCRLIDDLAPLVYSSALRQTGDRLLADDVTQNVVTLLGSEKLTAFRSRQIGGLSALTHLTTGSTKPSS